MNLLIVSPNSKKLYQNLSSISAIEPNIWAGLLANSVRDICGVSIMDLEADPVSSDQDLASRVDTYSPDFVLFVVTGQNPNASTAAMDGAVETAEKISQLGYRIGFVGPHVNALPHEVLQKHKFIDLVFTNEGVYALRNLINNKFDPRGVNGVWYLSEHGLVCNPPERVVPQELLEKDLPGVAYDLMPSLDKYRTSTWHTNFIGNTSPFASIYTSLGCFAKCSFCLHGKTKITYSDSKSKNIEDILIGDKLIGWDETINDYAETTVVNTSKRISNNYYKITLNTNRYIKSIKCTAEHPFYLNGKWIKAEDLVVGDKLMMIGKHDKSSFRMKKNNPCFVDGVASKGAKTRKKNGFIPAMCNSEKIEKIRVSARNRGLSKDNPMLKEENRKKASERMSGENNPCWAGGISKVFIEYPPEFNSRLKRKIRKRDGLKCQKCEANSCRLDVHHIDYDKNNNDECNLITLCTSCHMKSNYNRDEQKEFYQELQKSRGFCPEFVEILSIEIIEDEINVHNIECSPHNNYFANNILVHNCMINIINRNSNDLNLASDSFNTFRYWSPEFTIKQLEYLASQGVTNLKIADEMFVYRPKHFLSLCELIIERGLKFNIWAYSRVDTAKPQYLETLKKAGVNHLALGIESASQTVRQEIDKGRFKEVNIRDIVKEIDDHGIGVGGNFIVGLPSDTLESMQQTYELALDLPLANMNVYCATSLPGSPLYLENKKNGMVLPEKYSEFGFLSYDHIPNSTEFLSSKEVLKFRDEFFQNYFTNESVLSRMNEKFGSECIENIKKMTSIKLKRKLLND